MPPRISVHFCKKGNKKGRPVFGKHFHPLPPAMGFKISCKSGSSCSFPTSGTIYKVNSGRGGDRHSSQNFLLFRLRWSLDKPWFSLSLKKLRQPLKIRHLFPSQSSRYQRNKICFNRDCEIRKNEFHNGFNIIPVRNS